MKIRFNAGLKILAIFWTFCLSSPVDAQFNLRRPQALSEVTDAVAVGDFNNDGLPDLVVASNKAESDVLLGNGNGTFRISTTVKVTGVLSHDAATADVNADGKTDIILAHYRDIGGLHYGQVSVFRGNGNGTFQDEEFYNLSNSVRGEASSLSVGDFNGDGKPDIAVGTFDILGSLSIMVNNGSGNFGSGFQYASGTSVYGAASGHLNNDSYTDVVTGQASGINIWYANSDGSMQAPVVINFSGGATGVVIDNFNTDSYLDIAVSGAAGEVKVFANSASGFNTSPSTYTISNLSLSDIGTADFNRDNKLDLVATNYSYNTLAVLYANSSGTFNSAVSFTVGNYPSGVAAGDFDNDGKTDLAVSNHDPTEHAGILMNAPNPARYYNDFEGDRKTDAAIFRADGSNPSNWWIQPGSASHYAVQFGLGTDKIVPGNYDGKDAKADIAVFRNGTWYILSSKDSTVSQVSFGLSGDKPVPADYDNDGKTDVAVFRPSDTTWYISKSSGGTSQSVFGYATDYPVAADYDGDGKADIAVFRPADGDWYLQQSSAGFAAIHFGANGDKPVPGDYDGDGRADLAVFRPGNATWYIYQSSNFSTQIVQFGSSTDILVPGEYTGDGKNDIAVFSGGSWSIKQSENGAPQSISFGQSGDIPIPSAYVP